MTTPLSLFNSWGHWFYQNVNARINPYASSRQSKLQATSGDNFVSSSAEGRRHSITRPCTASSSWRILSVLTKVLSFQYALGGVPTNPHVGTIPVPDIDRRGLHPREIKAIDSSFSGFFDSYRTAQEWLRFRKDDPREKFLYLTADHDNDQNPALDPDDIYHIVSDLNKKYDIKYKVVLNYQEVCQQIKEAASVGKLAHIIIHGHGNPELILLSENPAGNECVFRGSQFYSCFSDLAINGKIVLLSCSTGKPQDGDPHENFAQDMATGSKRSVIAATDLVFAKYIKTLSIDPIMFLHDPLYYKGDLVSTHFRVFYPRFASCKNLIEKDLHPREQAVINAVSANLISRKLLWDQPTFTEMQDYLRLCKDNKKKKFLFLSSKEENCTNVNLRCSHNPTGYPKLLTDIAEQFDIRFKVIERENDICTEVRSAAQIGEIAAVLIHAPGKPNKLRLDDMPIEDAPAKFPECLSEIPLEARIFLVGGATGSAPNGDSGDNLASRVARETGRIVFAPTDYVSACKLTLKSSDPVELYYPNPIPHFLFSFMDREENLFKKFKEQQNKVSHKVKIKALCKEYSALCKKYSV